MNNKHIKPIMFDEVVYEDDSILVRKICLWENCSLWGDRETIWLKVLLPGSKAFNVGCIGTYALPDGIRATEMEFSYIGDFKEGLAKIAVKDKGYGFIDKNMNIVVEPKYKYANDFNNGVAVVSILDEVSNNKKYLLIDKNGNERFFEKEYKRISIDNEWNNEGMFLVSDREKIELAFYSDYEENSGVWGYADSTGKEIVKPQYIYAFDFEDGFALVCKGEWTIDKKWDNKYKTGKYWTETELWGMIDKTGKEVVPFIFDEIHRYWINESSKYLQAHYGGWEEGKWGLINYSGEWIIEPIFEDLDYEIYNDEYICFYNEDKWSAEEVPMGIYSIKERRVLFEPQFLDVDFFDEKTIKVEKYDEKLGRNKQIIIDLNGNVLVDSQYASIYEKYNYEKHKKSDMYEVSIIDNNGKHLCGLIDKDGKEILPCKYDMRFDGILFDQKRIIYKENDKYGIITFNDEIIISPKYTSIQNIRNMFYEVKVGGDERLIDDEGKFGLITLDGNTILPIEYKSISMENDIIIARNNAGSTLFRVETKRPMTQ
ncbi:hypothetical protein R84B8_00062 [Treponema sp. R8-4-B8]